MDKSTVAAIAIVTLILVVAVFFIPARHNNCCDNMHKHKTECVTKCECGCECCAKCEKCGNLESKKPCESNEEVKKEVK
jgi:hypothetical protein